MFTANQFLDLEQTTHQIIFDNVKNVWEVLPKIADYLKFRLEPGIHGKLIGHPFISDTVFIGPGTTIEHGAVIKGPAWIGSNCQIRSGCYIRENVIVGDDCVLGNSCEFKNCLIFNDCQIPHFNYVGDSILGHKAHLGAGVICSNVKLDHAEIQISDQGTPIPTGLRKFGAIIGDHVEIGCNSVLSPGSIVGRNAIIYPGTQWRGILPENTIAKLRQQIEVTTQLRSS